MLTCKRFILFLTCMAVAASMLFIIYTLAKRPASSHELETAPAPVVPTGRITLEYAGNVDGFKPVYVLRDTKTGQEYLAITNIGVVSIPKAD